jgi:hypothetical protein
LAIVCRLVAAEVDVGWRQNADALVIAQAIVVGDEGLDLGFEITRQVVVLERDSVLEPLSQRSILLWGIGCTPRTCWMMNVALRLHHRRQNS